MLFLLQISLKIKVSREFRYKKQVVFDTTREKIEDKKMNTAVIETERLILRRFTEGDMEAVREIFGDEEVNRFLPWFPVRSLEEVREFYEERYAEKYRQGDGYYYAVCWKGNGVPVGYVNVEMGEAVEFGYGLRKEFWGNGVITEAGKAVIERLKRDGIPYITATHDVRNPRSGEVMKRLGMKYQYSYEEQWQPKDLLVTFRMYQLNLDGDEDRVSRGSWDAASVHFVENI